MATGAPLLPLPGNAARRGGDAVRRRRLLAGAGIPRKSAIFASSALILVSMARSFAVRSAMVLFRVAFSFSSCCRRKSLSSMPPGIPLGEADV